MSPLIYDISPPVSDAIAVWPGDTPFSRTVQMDVNEGQHMTLSSFSSTVHVGAHADAPIHFAKGGAAIDQMDLEAYLGPCAVVTCGPGREVTVDHCRRPVGEGARRILFKTQSYPDPHTFNESFMAVSKDAMTFMGDAGVLLVGIDTPSVDPFESKTLEAHHEMHRYGIRNLEGLVLTHVTDGLYELIALPLKLVGFDASPVRAILRTISKESAN